jgi:hypothetical protein
MKTNHFLLIAGLLLSAGLTNLKATENETKSQAYVELDQQLQQTLKNFPIEEISSIDEYSRVTLFFTVNKNHEMENIKVSGLDENLVQYVKHTLELQKVKLNPYFDGRSCRVPIRVIDARR